jgi:two-component system alkaline phosphatase synthesis response regulator PhoP
VAGLRSVMLVEDEVMIRDLYRSALVKSHYRVEIAGGAEELYRKLLNFHPDCVFLDIMLPGVSGLEILKELRNNPAHGCQDAKIVILTNLAQRSVTESVVEAGADGYIIKADILPKQLPDVIASLEA